MSTVGCHSGLLTDPSAYFFDLIHRQIGENADDWEQVLDSCPMPTAPGDPHPPAYDNGFYGFEMMRGAAGNSRGRLFIPATAPTDGWYRHEMQVIEDDPNRPGKLRWAWFKWSGAGAYAPGPCDSSTPEPPDPDDPVDNMAILLALAAIADRLSRIEEDLRTPVVMVGGVEVANLVFPITLTEQQP